MNLFEAIFEKVSLDRTAILYEQRRIRYAELRDQTLAVGRVLSVLEVEPNFGQGMWVAAFQPILAKFWAKGGATVQESEWAKGQKEVCIIDTLEPVLTQHRLVVAESFPTGAADR